MIARAGRDPKTQIPLPHHASTIYDSTNPDVTPLVTTLPLFEKQSI